MKINQEVVNKVLEILPNFECPEYDVKAIEDIFNQIKSVLDQGKVKVEKSKYEIENYFIRYYFRPASVSALKKAMRLVDDIKLHLQCLSVRACLKEDCVCFEVVNPQRNQVGLKELLGQAVQDEKENGCYFVLGKAQGQALNCDITKMPHLLIGGATGSGKSILIHEIITSLITRYSPDQLKLLLVDPKGVEFAVYDGLPHLLNGHFLMEGEQVFLALEKLIEEMNNRYECFAKCALKSIDEYDKYAEEFNKEKLPRIVAVIDEFADFTCINKKEFEKLVFNLTVKCRAAGIYLILSTQRPSKDTITPLIRSGLPSRIACKLTSMADSKLLIDEKGAERLIGWGDLLYKSVAMIEPIRALAGYIGNKEIKNVVSIVKNQYQEN